MDTRVPDGHRRTDRNIDRCLRRRYKISFILISRRARRIRTKKTDRISSGTWKNDYVKRAAMETREEKQQGRLITRKRKEQIKLTNDCPTPPTLCTMPYAHTHTHDLQHSYTTLSMTSRREWEGNVQSRPRSLNVYKLATYLFLIIHKKKKRRSSVVVLCVNVLLLCACSCPKNKFSCMTPGGSASSALGEFPNVFVVWCFFFYIIHIRV